MNKVELKAFPQDIHSGINAATELWEDMYFAMNYADRVLVHGKWGSGKSRLGRYIGLGDRLLETTTITPETCFPEIRGHYGMTNNGMSWLDGPGTRCWREGRRWCIDEIDQAGGDTIPGLHMYLDDLDVARITLPTGETITPKEGFQVFATTNQMPQSLPEALCDRFVIKREINVPDPAMLLTFPEQIRVAAAYSLYNPHYLGPKFTSRMWVELGRLMNKHGLDTKTALSVLVAGKKKAQDAALAIECAAKKVVKVTA